MMKLVTVFLTAFTFVSCTASDPSATDSPVPEWTDLSESPKPNTITQSPWAEVIIGVQTLDDVPRLFTEIGGFETVKRDEADWVLRASGSDSGYVHFKRVDGNAVPTRPFGSRSWDTGCYFSVMMRAKNIASIVADAKSLGWEPLTDIAYLEFGPSQLNIIVLRHKKTGIQVQLYERLSTPLPAGFTPFERLSRPFNIMQMVENRNASYGFFRQGLGFDNFYFGKPTVSATPEISPIGIPKNLTTKVAYHAGITTPKPGLEWGRMEMIQVDMESGKNLSERCLRNNIGITEVRFNIEDLEDAHSELDARDVSYKMNENILRMKTPDGANISFSRLGEIE